MKTFVVLALSIVLVSILFCSMVMAAPPMPDDVQIVQPDPSLPIELSAFWGKWGGIGQLQYFLIVEKIDPEKASIYHWQSGSYYQPPGWTRYEAKVIKERGKYKLWFKDRYGNVELTLTGEDLDWSATGSEGLAPQVCDLNGPLKLEGRATGQADRDGKFSVIWLGST